MKDLNYFSKNDLKKRGWTDTIIEHWGLEHDFEKPNPYDSSRAPMKLYLKDKVKRIEEREDFQGYLQWSQWFRQHMKDVKRNQKEK